MPDLKPHRVHEALGPGRHVFMLFQAMRAGRPVVWVRPEHTADDLLPAGLPPAVATQIVLVTPRTETDLLWSVEGNVVGVSPVGGRLDSASLGSHKEQIRNCGMVDRQRGWRGGCFRYGFRDWPAIWLCGDA